MNIIDIKCQDSVNSSLNCCHLELPKDPLRLGSHNQIYLFINLPVFINSRQIDEVGLFSINPPFGEGDCNAESEENKYYLFRSRIISAYTAVCSVCRRLTGDEG